MNISPSSTIFLHIRIVTLPKRCTFVVQTEAEQPYISSHNTGYPEEVWKTSQGLNWICGGHLSKHIPLVSSRERRDQEAGPNQTPPLPKPCQHQ
jgi:hypothetical protein